MECCNDLAFSSQRHYGTAAIGIITGPGQKLRRLGRLPEGDKCCLPEGDQGCLPEGDKGCLPEGDRLSLEGRQWLSS